MPKNRKEGEERKKENKEPIMATIANKSTNIESSRV
jgi:hypothetical protein